MIKKLSPAIALAVASSFAAPAMASTINVGLQDPNGNVFADAHGDNSWRIVTSFRVNHGATQNVYAGAFRLTGDTGGQLSEFLAFCLQPLEVLNLPKEHMIGSIFSDTITTNLNILAANAWNDVTDSISAAAFQIAAWELTTETADQFNITDGAFKITKNSTASNQAEALAQTWLTNIDDDIWTDQGDEFVILNANNTQDLLTNVAAVPLPASGLLLLGGLFGAGAVARRRKASKT